MKTAGMIILFVVVLLLAVLSRSWGQTINPGESATVKCNSCPVCPTPTPVPVPMPTPKPTATPAPTPAPPSVVCSKTARTATEAQSAVNSSVAGQTVCIEESIKFAPAFYPKKDVRIHCKPGVKLEFDGGNQEGVRFNTNVSGAQIDGCEITGGWDGVKVTGDNNTVRNNYIHGNKYQGVLVTAASGNTIEGNRIERSGTSCVLSSPIGESPRHCHDVYLSNPSGYCKPMNGNKVINNFLGSIGGAAVNINSEPCKSEKIRNTVISGNEILNANMCVALYYGTDGTVIENNMCTILNPYPSNLPVSMKYGVITWGAPSGEPRMNNNDFILKSDYGEYKKN